MAVRSMTRPTLRPWELGPAQTLRVVWNTLARFLERPWALVKGSSLEKPRRRARALRGLVVAPLLDLSQDGRHGAGEARPLDVDGEQAVLRRARCSLWCRGAKAPAGLAFAAGHRCSDVLRSLYELSLRRRHVAAVTPRRAVEGSASPVPHARPQYSQRSSSSRLAAAQCRLHPRWPTAAAL